MVAGLLSNYVWQEYRYFACVNVFTQTPCTHTCMHACTHITTQSVKATPLFLSDPVALSHAFVTVLCHCKGQHSCCTHHHPPHSQQSRMATTSILHFLRLMSSLLDPSLVCLLSDFVCLPTPDCNQLSQAIIEFYTSGSKKEKKPHCPLPSTNIAKLRGSHRIALLLW